MPRSICYWQASQPGSSIAQNLMSVAGDTLICACAVAAAASSAFMLPVSSVKPMVNRLAYFARLGASPRGIAKGWSPRLAGIAA